MSGKTECRQGEHRDGSATATVRIRHQYADDRRGTWSWTTDMCDRHGALTYERFIREGRRNVEIMPAGWTPAGDREQRIAERISELMDEIVSVELHPINLDPYPASVGEVADEVARYVLELEDSGVARGLAGQVLSRLADWQSDRDEQASVHLAEIDPEDAF